jgi:hypothetical protein
MRRAASCLPRPAPGGGPISNSNIDSIPGYSGAAPSLPQLAQRPAILLLFLPGSLLQCAGLVAPLALAKVIPDAEKDVGPDGNLPMPVPAAIRRRLLPWRFRKIGLRKGAISSASQSTSRPLHATYVDKRSTSVPTAFVNGSPARVSRAALLQSDLGWLESPSQCEARGCHRTVATAGCRRFRV